MHRTAIRRKRQTHAPALQKLTGQEKKQSDKRAAHFAEPHVLLCKNAQFTGDKLALFCPFRLDKMKV